MTQDTLKLLMQSHCNSPQSFPTRPAVIPGILPCVLVIFWKLTKLRAQDANVVLQCAKDQSTCVFCCISTAPKLWSLLPYSGHEKSDRKGLELKRNWYVQNEEKEEQEIYTVKQHHLMQPWFHTDIFSSLQHFASVRNKHMSFPITLPILCVV